MMNDFSEAEINLLSIGTPRYTYYDIAEEILVLANSKVVEHLTGFSEDRYEMYVQKIMEHIKDFAFSGSVAGDYETENYSEEFCVILQENYDMLYEICRDDIYGYILKVLEKAHETDIKLLYLGTDEEINEGIENPLSIHTGMNDCIADKLFNMISNKASHEDIMYILYPDEG